MFCFFCKKNTKIKIIWYLLFCCLLLTYCSTSTCLYCSFYTTWSLIPGRPFIYPRTISRVIFLSPAPASLSTQEFSDVLFLTSFTLVKQLIVSHFIWHSYQFVYVFTNMQPYSWCDFFCSSYNFWTCMVWMQCHYYANLADKLHLRKRNTRFIHCFCHST